MISCVDLPAGAVRDTIGREESLLELEGGTGVYCVDFFVVQLIELLFSSYILGIIELKKVFVQCFTTKHYSHPDIRIRDH